MLRDPERKIQLDPKLLSQAFLNGELRWVGELERAGILVKNPAKFEHSFALGMDTAEGDSRLHCIAAPAIHKASAANEDVRFRFELTIIPDETRHGKNIPLVPVCDVSEEIRLVGGDEAAQ